MKHLAAPLVALLCTACSLAPDYHRPTVDAPKQFGSPDLFQKARPADSLPKGAWWEIYSDRTLDALETKLGANQDLKAALSRLQQAQSVLKAQRASLFPTLSVGAASQKINTSQNRATYFKGVPTRYRDNLLTADISYEADVFGRLANMVAVSRQQMEASKADLAALQLSLQAELAADYFTLQALRVQQKTLKDLVENEGEYLKLTRALLDGGAVPEADVDEAELALQNAKTQEQDAALQAQTITHAIALLLGQPATGFEVPASDSSPEPWMGAILPSKLLERRPDIASAERQVEAANAAIGIARAAYFPQFTLNAQGGYESSQVGNWISVPSELWSLGAGAVVTLFDAGQRSALTDAARERYEETVANYRQTVLNAYREVEDSLSAVHQLNLEHASARHALQSARRAAEQAGYRYRGGMASYLEVVTAQTQILQAREQLALLEGRRMTASVLLVKALGGGPR
ncbi:MAG: efflux transporter outer membrane subunit [Burkholderiales bacterium]